MRNVFCEKYNTCLSAAAYSDTENFNCSGCKDKSYAEKVGDISKIPRLHKQTHFPENQLGTIEAAIYLGINKQQLYYLRKKGEGPEHIQLKERGGLIVYNRDDLRRWKEAVDNMDADPPTEVTTSGAAKIIGITTSYLQKLRVAGKGPPCRVQANCTMYKITDAEEFRRVRNQLNLEG